MASKDGIDWNAIRAEYIAGGIGQRKLAEKHGVKYAALRDKCCAEGWVSKRQEAQRKIIADAVQKTANAVADNAVIAQRIHRKLLLRLERALDDLPKETGTRVYTDEIGAGVDKKGKPVKRQSGIEYKLRDLTAAYKDLTADIMPEQGKGNELLQSLYDLEQRRRDDGD